MILFYVPLSYVSIVIYCINLLVGSTGIRQNKLCSRPASWAAGIILAAQKKDRGDGTFLTEEIDVCSLEISGKNMK